MNYDLFDKEALKGAYKFREQIEEYKNNIKADARKEALNDLITELEK